MARKRLNPSVKRSRTRSGCLTCRDRHMKCDEQQPVCKNCIKSKRKCYRGIRLNFTQYTIYNPERTSLGPREFKFLDQSITIASLYEDGKQMYEPYLHLHRKEDLKESDLQYQQDIYSSFPPFPSLSAIKHETSANFDNNTILENHNITNLLMNNENSNDSILLSGTSMNNLASNQGSRIAEGSSNSPVGDNYMYNIDIQLFIDLIENEKYYWILDLFNEMSIWKSVIPTYCLKENENGQQFLINCLLNCSVNSNIDFREVTYTQKDLWNSLKNKQVTNDNFKLFEKLFVSIVLVLLHFNIKYSKSLIKFTNSNKNLLNNQIKIFNQLIRKFDDLNLKKFQTIILISSIHSIIILKFLITKLIESDGLIEQYNPKQSESGGLGSEDDKPRDEIVKSFFQSESYINKDFTPEVNLPELDDNIRHSTSHDNYVVNPEAPDSSEEILYDESNNLETFLTLNRFEIMSLNSFFKKLDYAQITGGFDTSINVKSDSLKLREFIWHLIKLNYVIKHPENKLIEVDYNFIFNDDNTILPAATKSRLKTTGIGQSNESADMSPYNTVLPNDRGVAINILREFITKLINLNDVEIINQSNSRLKQIFKIINDSMVDNDIKTMWNTHFSWTWKNINYDSS